MPKTDHDIDEDGGPDEVMIFESHKNHSPGPDMLTERLCAALPRASLALTKAVTRHKDALTKPLWSEAIFAVHIQDDRLTHQERRVIAAIGKRLYGPRVVV